MPIVKKLVFDKTTILTNEFLQDKEISLSAKGLLGYMLSLPNNWDFTIKGIATQTNESEYKITKLLQELEKNGYHTKKHLYENGRIKDWIYYIFAEPRQDIINKTFDTTNFEQELENQDVEKQESCFQYDKQTISNKLDIEQDKKETIKKDNVEKDNFKLIPSTNINNITVPNKKLDIRDKKENLDIAVNIDKYAEVIIEKTNDKLLKENVKCIIDYLNESIGSNYRYDTKGTINLIKARFKEGYKLDDFYDVIDKKVKEWYNTEMQQYLRPSTLFGNKFEGYLNQTYFKGKAKSSYSSKPNFDNTSNHRVPKGVASMTEEEKQDFYQNNLAKDKDGNYIKF